MNTDDNRSELRYQHTVDGVETADLEGFFVGWPSSPSPERHLEILEASHSVVLAIDDAARSDEPDVVGFVNAISDGLLAAYIPLLEVRPNWQDRGIGTELVQRIRTDLGDLYMVDALCDPEVAGFYERLGFQRTTGMAYRDYENRSD